MHNITFIHNDYGLTYIFPLVRQTLRTKIGNT